MIVCYAMGNSISIVVGQQLGAGEIERAKDYDLKRENTESKKRRNRSDKTRSYNSRC